MFYIFIVILEIRVCIIIFDFKKLSKVVSEETVSSNLP